MSIMSKKSVIDIMTESANAEDFDGIFNDEIEKELDDHITNLEECVDHLIHTPEMIPVFQNENSFYVEFSDLQKLLECDEEECDDDDDDEDDEDEHDDESFEDEIIDALESVIYANNESGMNMENTYVVIESDQELRSIVSEIKATIKSASGVDKKTGKAKLTKAKDVFKTLKNKGLKLVKKKSKKKSKKKK